MNEPLLAELWDEYLFVFGQLKSLGGDVLIAGTTPHQPACLVLYLVGLTMSKRSVTVSIEQGRHKFLVRENVKSAEIYRRLHA